MQSLSFDAIGTHWQIDYVGVISGARALERDILSLIDRYDLAYSRFRSDGLIAQIARSSGTYTLPDDSKELFDVYQKLYRASVGSLTPLIGQTVSDAGYDASYSLHTKALSVPPSWEDMMSFSHPKLLVKKPVLLDFGAAGKGHLIDLVAELLERNDILDYTVDAGGDSRQRGNSPTRIGLEDPLDTSKAIGVVTLHNQSLCGSAGNRRAWGTYHHIIDPKTLESPKNVLATWVVADSTLIADGIATCLFLTPPEKILPYFSFSYCILNPDFSLTRSPDFPAEFFH